MCDFYKAIENNDVSTIEQLLDIGTDPNMFKDWHRFACVYPLSYAIQCNNLEVARVLLERGADPLFLIDEDEDCSSAMASAILIAKSIDAVKLLFEFGHPPSKQALLYAMQLN